LILLGVPLHLAPCIVPKPVVICGCLLVDAQILIEYEVKGFLLPGGWCGSWSDFADDSYRKFEAPIAVGARVVTLVTVDAIEVGAHAEDCLYKDLCE
jgi:hypothetical protein